MIDILNLISFVKDDCTFTNVTDISTLKSFSNSREKTGSGFVFKFINQTSYLFSYRNLYTLAKRNILGQLTNEQFIFLLEAITLLEDEWEFEGVILEDIENLLIEMQDI